VWEATTFEESIRMLMSGSVTRLRVNGSFNVDKVDMKRIASALNSEKGCVETLWLRNCGIPSDPAEAVSSCFKGTILKELYLEDNALGDSGIIDICNFMGTGEDQIRRVLLASNRTLVTLRLDGNGIASQGLASLADSLKVHPCLTELSLARNSIQSSHVDDFSECMKRNTMLKDLSLSGNQIGPKFPMKIMYLQGLEVLDLSSNIIEELTNTDFRLGLSIGAHRKLRNMNLKGNTPSLQKWMKKYAAKALTTAASSPPAVGGAYGCAVVSSKGGGWGKGAGKERCDGEEQLEISWKLVHATLIEFSKEDAKAMDSYRLSDSTIPQSMDSGVPAHKREAK